MKRSNWINVLALATFLVGAVGAGTTLFLVPSIPSSAPVLPQVTASVMSRVEEEMRKLGAKHREEDKQRLEAKRQELLKALRELTATSGYRPTTPETLTVTVGLDSSLDQLRKQEIALAILERDVRALREHTQEQLIALRSEHDRVYDLMKWVISLMGLVSVGLIGTAVSNVFRKEHSRDHTTHPQLLLTPAATLKTSTGPKVG